MATAGAHTQSPNMILRPIESNMRWTAGPITYNIVTLDNATELNQFNGSLPAGNQPMNTDFQPVWATEFALAFNVFEEFINIDLQLNNDPNAVFLIGQDITPVDPANPDEVSLGFSDTPRAHGPGQNLIQAYNITDPSGTTNAETGGGNDRFHTILHELSHSIGLSHPHATDEGTTSTGVADTMQPVPYQQHQTVVSYTLAPNVPNGGAGTYQFGYAASPMALDVAALQNMYGANMNTRTGNSTYTLTDAATAALVTTGNAISVGRAYYNIWDAGTDDTDTIQYAGAARVLINLNAATLSNTPPADVAAVTAELQASAAFATLSAEAQAEITNNAGTAAGFFSSILDGTGTRIQGGFSIANGVVIENATGGSANDILLGNAADNLLTANAGNDLLIGGNGNDRLDTGLGSDTASGGAGDDTYLLTASVAGNRDSFNGGTGSDTADFSGFASAMWVDLDFANTQAWTQDDQDAVNPSGTWRRVADLMATENIVGTNGIDDLRGNAGDNIFGYRGSAAITGVEQINGRDGVDTADFSGFVSAVWVDLQFSGTEGWTKDFTNVAGGTWREIANLTSIENLIGTNAVDNLRGDAGNNVFGYRGTAAITGVERIYGRDGVDTADFSGFASAVWVDLQFSGSDAWTKDLTTLTGGTWRAIADLISVENITGTNCIDNLRGDAGNNVFGYRGTAAITGVEQMYGRDGVDTADFSSFASAVWVDLQFSGSNVWTKDLTTLTGGTWREIANLSSIESITGTAFADNLRGDAGANTLVGGRGNDLMLGRAGNDIFSFSDGFDGDIIQDFDASDLEKIDLSQVTNITSFADLTGNHLRTDAGTGFAEIFDGTDTLRLDGYTVAQIGAGLAISENDFTF